MSEFYADDYHEKTQRESRRESHGESRQAGPKGWGQALEAAGPEWLTELRRRAIARYQGLGGVPTTRDEEYKYTSLKRLVRSGVVPAQAPSGAVDIAAALERLGLHHESASTRLVLVDGFYVEALSSYQSLPERATVCSLGQAIADAEHGEYLRSLWEGQVDEQPYPFAAVNTAFMTDGAFVHVPRGTRIEQPIEVVYLATAQATPTAAHPRTVVRVDESAEVTIVETYASLAEAPYLTNAVIELDLGENAFLDHYRVEEESSQAFHVHLTRLRQKRSSNLTTHTFMFGGRLVRNDIHGKLEGEGIECILNGLYMGRGDQHIDNHSAIDHMEPHCHSYELYKGVLDGQSTAVFNGKIFVRQKAQKTDAVQSNKNLLLSSDASVNTKPQLEIWADDVKCTHGATIGQLDREALFYLRTRGLSTPVAKSVLTYAFANEVIDNVKVEPLREWLERELAEWLPRTAELEAAR